VTRLQAQAEARYIRYQTRCHDYDPHRNIRLYILERALEGDATPVVSIQCNDNCPNGELVTWPPVELS
jgi:hypothetical protein